MYKLLLCWRYLLTRYLALVCIVSVMLGVATLIVVNSVMAGFSTKLRDRLHGLLSDIVIEACDYEGFANPDGKMARIQADPFLSQRIEAMTPTLEIFGMIRFNYNGMPIARPVRIIGIDPIGRTRVGGFAEHLQINRGQPSFELNAEAVQRQRLLHPPHRLDRMAALMALPAPDGRPAPEPPPSREFVPCSIIVGYAVAHFRAPGTDAASPHEIRTLEPGDDVIVTTISGLALKPVEWRCAVCDYFHSEMSEYDANYVFVPLEELQRLRTMEGRATSIQIRFKDYRDLKAVKRHLQDLFNARAVGRADLGGQARTAAGGHQHREGHPQRAAVHDYRRGRLRHPGHFLDDRGREDARHRHPQGAGRVQHRRAEHLPGLRSAARHRWCRVSAPPPAWPSPSTSTRSSNF